jgi:hypothetical protein
MWFNITTYVVENNHMRTCAPKRANGCCGTISAIRQRVYICGTWRSASTLIRLISRRARKDAFLEDIWHNKRLFLVGRHENIQTAHDGLASDRPFSAECRKEAFG